MVRVARYHVHTASSRFVDHGVVLPYRSTIRKHRGAPAPGAPMVSTPMGLKLQKVLKENGECERLCREEIYLPLDGVAGFWDGFEAILLISWG